MDSLIPLTPLGTVGLGPEIVLRPLVHVIGECYGFTNISITYDVRRDDSHVRRNETSPLAPSHAGPRIFVRL